LALVLTILIGLLITRNSASYGDTTTEIELGISSYLKQINQVPQLPIRDRLLLACEKWSVNCHELLVTMKCESNYREDAIGDSGNSIGVFQIHLPSHPSITKECAHNYSCIESYALQLFKRRPEAWTCWKNNFN